LCSVWNDYWLYVRNEHIEHPTEEPCKDPYIARGYLAGTWSKMIEKKSFGEIDWNILRVYVISSLLADEASIDNLRYS
jgi:hypothetical protein